MSVMVGAVKKEGKEVKKETVKKSTGSLPRESARNTRKGKE